MKTNLYDFDKTIYNGDSTLDFYFFCLRRKVVIIKYLPIFFIYFILFKLNKKTKEDMKEKFYLFLTCFDNINVLVEDFWKYNERKIKEFYRVKSNKNDIVISASPEFLLRPICNKLSINNLIASKVDSKTGRYIGKNCAGEEKVNRLKKEFNNIVIEEVYSDSYDDTPILKLGKKSYLVKKNKLVLLKEKEFDNI